MKTERLRVACRKARQYVPQAGILQGILQLGLKEACRLAGIKSQTLYPCKCDLPLRNHAIERIGMIVFTARVMLPSFLYPVEKFRRIQIAPDRNLVAGLGTCRRLFDKAPDAHPIRLRIDNAVSRHIARIENRREHAFAGLFVDFGKLAGKGDFAQHDIIRICHHTGFIAQQMAHLHERMARTAHFGLPHEGEAGGGRSDCFEPLALSFPLEHSFELDFAVEVVFKSLFSSAGDNDDIGNARLDKFLYDVGNARYYSNGKQFLGNGFGYWQKACTVSSSDNDTFHEFDCNGETQNAQFTPFIGPVLDLLCAFG